MNRHLKLLAILTIALIFGGTVSNLFAQNRPLEIADGRNLLENAKASQSAAELIKKEIRGREQAIKNLAKDREFKCDEDDAQENLANENLLANLDVRGGFQGAFTKPKSSQKIYSYQICWSDGGKYATALGGIIVVEKQSVVSHFAFAKASGIDFLRVLPDINRNGFSEIALGFAGASGLRIWRSMEIVEIGAGKVMSFGEAQTYETTDDEALALKVSAKAGKTPVFYHEIYSDNADDDKANWKLKEKSKPFSLERVNAESSFRFENLPAGDVNAPLLTSEDISRRVLKLIKNLRQKKDISPENIERQTETKLSPVQNGSYSHRLNGKIKDTSWFYILGFNAEVSEITFTFSDPANRNADLTPICAIDFDIFGAELKKAGFSARRRISGIANNTGEKILSLNSYSQQFARGKILVTILPKSENQNPGSRKCIEMITVS